MRIAMAGLCVAMCACAGTATTTHTASVLKMARTTSNELGPALQRLPDIRGEIATEGGSSINSLIDLREGKVDIISPVADVAYLAYAGQLEEMREPFDQLRGLAVINLNTVHLLVAPNTKARSLRDLRGLHISLGAPGSSTALITERMLVAHGIPPGSVRVERIPNAEMLRKLVRNEIDAAFVMYNPASQSAATAMKNGARLIDVDGPIVEQIRTEYPHLKRTLIPANTYPNQPEPIHTVGIDTALVCRADLDETLVFRLLDAYFATRPPMTPPNLERAPATPIPLHIGAARFYRQRELSR